MEKKESLKNLPEADYNLWWWISQMHASINQSREYELARYGLSWIQSAVLFTVNSINGNATPTEISHWLMRKKNTVSELLTRMEKRGMIKRVKDAHQKKQVNILLTQKGREMYSRSNKRESLKNIFSCLSKEEHQQLRLLCCKLRNRVAEIDGRKHNLPWPL
jgi:DNA-binding MarR family transcriptional regulator